MAAKKECKNTCQLPWDKITQYTMTELNILRCMISSENNSTDNEEMIETKTEILNDP